MPCEKGKKETARNLKKAHGQEQEKYAYGMEDEG